MFGRRSRYVAVHVFVSAFARLLSRMLWPSSGAIHWSSSQQHEQHAWHEHERGSADCEGDRHRRRARANPSRWYYALRKQRVLARAKGMLLLR